MNRCFDKVCSRLHILKAPLLKVFSKIWCTSEQSNYKWDRWIGRLQLQSLVAMDDKEEVMEVEEREEGEEGEEGWQI